MFETFGRSWKLVKASYAVLRQDKELLWFPVASTIGLIVVTFMMFLPLAATGIFGAVEAGEELTGAQSFTALIVTFLFYFVTYTIIIYSNTALIGAAMIRLDGGDPTVRDGIQVAQSRLGTILGWAFIASIVGMILQALQNMARDSDNIATAIIGSILVGLAGFAWNLITFLVIPVYVIENVGPIEAIKRSASLLKSTWGENITGSFSMGIISFLVMLGIFLVIGLPLFFIVSALGSGILMFVAIAIVVFLIGAVSIFFSALNAIFQASLYKYASGDREAVGEFFPEEMVAGAFQPKAATR
jgi:hypothetical protein